MLKTGYSQALRHIQRTHGIDLRALHERFKEPWYHLAYQRSSLMSADIYTKGFADAPAWQLAQRLINHIDPDLFWGGRRMSKSLVMPTEHKGGVIFDYWVSNPWLNHTIKPPTPAAPGLAPGEQVVEDTPGTSAPPAEVHTLGGEMQHTNTTTAKLTTAAPAAAADDDQSMEDKTTSTTSSCKSGSRAGDYFEDSIVDKLIGGDWPDPSVSPTPARHSQDLEAGSAPEAGADDSASIGTANPVVAASLRPEVPVLASPQSPLDYHDSINITLSTRRTKTRRSQGGRRRFRRLEAWSTT